MISHFCQSDWLGWLQKLDIVNLFCHSDCYKISRLQGETLSLSFDAKCQGFPFEQVAANLSLGDIDW
jgi:hypothetical protein